MLSLRAQRECMCVLCVRDGGVSIQCSDPCGVSLAHRFQSLVNDVAALGRGIEKIAQRCSFQQDILEQSTVSLLQDYSGILHTVPVSPSTIGCVCVRACVCRYGCVG